MILAAPAAAEEIMITCDMTKTKSQAVFILDPEQGIARRVDYAEERKGFLKVTDHAYEIMLPGTERSYPAKATILRYTGKISLTWGKEPLNASSLGNLYDYGSCQLAKAEKKF